jgi:hypothetical protein
LPFPLLPTSHGDDGAVVVVPRRQQALHSSSSCCPFASLYFSIFSPSLQFARIGFFFFFFFSQELWSKKRKKKSLVFAECELFSDQHCLL